jgi:hypothetical protein
MDPTRQSFKTEATSTWSRRVAICIIFRRGLLRPWSDRFLAVRAATLRNRGASGSMTSRTLSSGARREVILAFDGLCAALLPILLPVLRSRGFFLERTLLPEEERVSVSPSCPQAMSILGCRVALCAGNLDVPIDVFGRFAFLEIASGSLVCRFAPETMWSTRLSSTTEAEEEESSRSPLSIVGSNIRRV